MAEPIVNKLIEVVTSLIENNSANNTANNTRNSAPADPKRFSPESESTESALRRLYPSVNGQTSKTTVVERPTTSTSTSGRLFNPKAKYDSKKGKKKSVKYSGTKIQERKTVLKDVILLPSPEVQEVPRGQFRELLYSKDYGKSAIEIADDMSEEEVKNVIDELYESALLSFPQARYEFVRAIGNKIISVPNGPFTGKLVKYISKQGPIYIRATKEIVHDESLKRWYKAERIDINDIIESSDDESVDGKVEPKNKRPKRDSETPKTQVKPSTDTVTQQKLSQVSVSRTSGPTSISNNESEPSTSCTYTTYCNIIAEDPINLDSDDDELQMAIAESLNDSNVQMNCTKDQFEITDQHQASDQDAGTRTRNFLSELQENGELNTIVSEAKRESEQIDESFGGGGKKGLPQFLKEHVTGSNKPHVEACKILASGKDEEISTIQEHLISSYPDTFAWGAEKMGFQGHIMTMATSSILKKMKEVDNMKKKSPSEILKGIQINPTQEDFQVIRVRRNHIWEDSLRAFKKPSFCHQKCLRVHFIGEEAEDMGGPRREYLRLLMKDLAEKSGVLEGPLGHKVITANPLLVFNTVYFYAGLMVSVSLRQGGPGICCLSPTLYSYICNHRGHDATLQDVVEYTARGNIEKIQNAEEKEFTETVKSLADFLIECGLSKLTWSFEDKSVLVKLLCSHFLIHRSKIGIDQFTDGLKAGGLLEHIQNYPIPMEEVFIYSNTPLDVSKFRSLLKYNLSPQGSNTREAEELAVLFWEEYLDEIDDDSTPELNPDTLKELLIFATGAEQIPPCGFDKQIEICFYEARESKNPDVCRLPHASTCSMTFYLPLGLEDFPAFKVLMAKSLEGYGGFGSI